MNVKEMRGRLVVGAGGRSIGLIHDVEFDVVGWRITQLVIKVEAGAVVDLGLKKPLWTRALLTVPVGDVQATSDNLVLKITIEDLAQRVEAARPSDED